MHTLPNDGIAKPEAAMLLKHSCDESSSDIGPGKTPENKNGQLH
jgi:hypothetical protein